VPTEVKLPQLGQTMVDGTIVGYLVKVGDKVKKGDVIFEIETDKATVEVESPADGFVRYILAEVGQTLSVGKTILILADKTEKIPKSLISSLKRTTVPRLVRASGVQPVAPAGLSAPPLEEVKLGQTMPLNRLQKITAQKMLQSKREIPCFYLNVKADVTDLVELRTKLNKAGSVKISYNDFVMRAVALGLEKFPIMTGHLTGDAIRLADSIGVGLAIFVPDGLVAPIIKDVHKKKIAQIASDREILVEKACNNKLTPADFEGGCITVSNLGAFGVDSFIPIVVPGQCSILGIGRITDVCVPGNSDIVVRKLMSLTLSVDHRITNGAYAAQFLDFVRKTLEDTANFL
jgi:pyruvate dehydrogenase E2 component (dihydrolipoamide acetyltransferase)